MSTETPEQEPGGCWPYDGDGGGGIEGWGGLG